MDTIKDNVEYLLKWHPKTRDNDNDLLIQYWAKYDGAELIGDIKYKTSAGSILRMRRLLKDEYPPNNNLPRLRKQAEMEVFLKGEKK